MLRNTVNKLWMALKDIASVISYISFCEEYSKHKACKVFNIVFDTDVKAYLGTLKYNDILFDTLYQKSRTKALSLSMNIFATTMCCLLPVVVSLLAIWVTFLSIEPAKLFEHKYIIGTINRTSLGLCFVFVFPIILMICHRRACRIYHEREFRDLLRARIQQYLNDESISPRVRRKLCEKWKSDRTDCW